MTLMPGQQLPSGLRRVVVARHDSQHRILPAVRRVRRGCGVRVVGRGLHSFLFQLNLSSSVHRITQPNSRMCSRVAQVELQRERV